MDDEDCMEDGAAVVISKEEQPQKDNETDEGRRRRRQDDEEKIIMTEIPLGNDRRNDDDSIVKYKKNQIEDDDGHGHGHHGRTRTRRTPIPSNARHLLLLMQRNLAADLFTTDGGGGGAHRRFWFFKTFSGALFFMLYTVGWFSSYQEPSSLGTKQGPYVTFESEAWKYPQRMYLGGVNETYVDTVATVLQSNIPSMSIIVIQTMTTTTNSTNSTTSMNHQTSFASSCQDTAENRTDLTCAWIDSEWDVTVYYGGGQYVYPNADFVAASQHAVHQGMLAASGYYDDDDSSILFSATTTQHTPRLLQNVLDTAPVPTAAMAAIGSLQVLSLSLAMMFVLSPLVSEKLEGVVQAFTIVGVDLFIYMMAWVTYLSAWNVCTALVLTGICIGWKLYPASNFLLIFLSQFQALIHGNLWLVLMAQRSVQEESAQGMPILMGLASIAIAVPFVTIDLQQYTILLSVLSVFSPFIGVVTFSAIYIAWDVQGKQVGIHWNDGTVQASGLQASLLGQMGGILFYTLLVYHYCRKRGQDYNNNRSSESSKSSCFKSFLSRIWANIIPRKGKDDDDDENDNDDSTSGTLSDVDPENFEDLAPDADVLLNVRDLHHTFPPQDDETKQRKVLRGMDLDVCRGELLGFLGINGAGKTTTIKILSSEIGLQEGTVEYNFRDGRLRLNGPDNFRKLRTKIGVCPQHNNLLGNATCRETLTFFAKLKGNILQAPGQTEEEAVETEVQRRLDQIQLTHAEDADKPVKTFSGGMKRKVSIAIAFLGDAEMVFLDEPTAGCDPLNRRIIWDMILESKKGRSIVLTSHFLDEVDLLSDRVAIIKQGRLVTCGRSLFLKHQFGTGYSLRFNAAAPVDVSSIVPTAKAIPVVAANDYQWNLKHGNEASFPDILRSLRDADATNVALELTTLEEVFLRTGRVEEHEDMPVDDEDQGDVDMGDENAQQENLRRIWEPRSERKIPSSWSKVMMVQAFMVANAMRIKKVILFNIAKPLIYIITGFVVTYAIGEPQTPQQVYPVPISVSPSLGQSGESFFFGVDELSSNPLTPMIAAPQPEELADYFSQDYPFTGGHDAATSTLEFNATWNRFAMQVGEQVLANYSALNAGSPSGYTTTIQQLVYMQNAGLNVPVVILPVLLGMGYSGVAFSVLDLLLLKADNIVALFRVAGINVFLTNLGVATYKFITTFVPFFIVTIILGLGFSSVIMGNAGRWLASIIMMLAYAFATTPMGLLFAQVFWTRDAASLRNWFPPLYMMTVSMPYIAWSMLFQYMPELAQVWTILADVLSIFPPFAFQRGLGQILYVSNEYNDPDLEWSTVYSWENRIWYSFVIMIVVGILEWFAIYILARQRPPRTAVPKDCDAQGFTQPVDVSGDDDIATERELSRASNDGIKARDLVKLFAIKPKRRKSRTIIKRAVKGVSFSVEKNEIYSFLGPNGAGKTSTMGVLAGEHTPEHGEIALAGITVSDENKSTDELFHGGDVAFCPQFDALFSTQSVLDHLRFYAKVRGFDWKDENVQQHVNAIIKLLGLGSYVNTNAGNLSGGYKRRLSLGLAMIGYPKTVIVDECTTGMDPAARYLVWEVLKPETRRGDYDLPAILLSTHYLDEAERLGTRVGILVDGELIASGSPEHLRSRYCNSYFVEVALDPDAPTSSADLQHGICAKFRERHRMNVQVTESLPYRFKLKVPYVHSSGNSGCNNASRDDLTQLADIFTLLEEIRAEMFIEFYSVAQMSLEQIFNELSRKQFDADESLRFDDGES